jgi:hypothetical protein
MILLSMILLKASTSSRRSRAVRRRIPDPCLPLRYQSSAISTPLSVLSRPTAPTFQLFPNFFNHQSARIKTNKNARIEVGFHSLQATRYSLPLRTVLTTSSRRSRAGFQNCNHWLQKAGHRPHHLRALPLASGIATRCLNQKRHRSGGLFTNARRAR